MPTFLRMDSSYEQDMNNKLLPLLFRFFLFLVFGIGGFSLSLVGALTVYSASFSDRIYPGVQMGWVNLSGLTVAEAADQLSSEYTYPKNGQIILRDGEQTWLVRPSELGLLLGSESNARSAFNLGRSGQPLSRLSTQFTAWYWGVDLPLTMVFNEETAQNYLGRLAAEMDRPVKEASLQVDGTDVVVEPGQVGRSLDIPATIKRIKEQLIMLRDGEIQVVVEETSPVILDVGEQAQIAEEILSESLVLRLPKSGDGDPGPWVFDPEELARMMVIERVSIAGTETYQVRLSSQLLLSFLEGISPGLYVKPENARFMFNDDTRELELVQPSVTGQFLDIETSVHLIQERVLSGEHRVVLDLEYTIPEVTSDTTAADLGITELVSSHTSYFYGSSASRKQNIATAASRFYGVLVAPGEIFSMADVLGDVTLDAGYEEAWIIFGDRTIKGVGGGVCQVSTTLFRTAFLGGYPVVERHPHAYRVYYYEQTYGGANNSKWAGLDATVYVPMVDFKFKNDGENWLLMETYVGDAYLTWKFYSSSDGRTVEWETTGLTNIQDPPDPLYQENNDLAKGEIDQVDWAVDGADVTITRYVFRDGEIIISDIFTTHYIPWRAVCEYGPGTPGMPPEDPDENNPCQPD